MTLTQRLPSLLALLMVLLLAAGCGDNSDNGGGTPNDTGTSRLDDPPALEMASYDDAAFDSIDAVFAAAVDLGYLVTYLDGNEDFIQFYEPLYGHNPQVVKDTTLPTGTWDIESECTGGYPKSRVRLVETHISQYHYYEELSVDDDDDDYDNEYGEDRDCTHRFNREDPMAAEQYVRVSGPGDSQRMEFNVWWNATDGVWGTQEITVKEGLLDSFEIPLTAERTRIERRFDRFHTRMSLLGTTFVSYRHGEVIAETEDRTTLRLTGEHFAFGDTQSVSGNDGPTTDVQLKMELTDLDLLQERTCGEWWCMSDTTLSGSGKLGGPALGGAAAFTVETALRLDADADPWPFIHTGRVQITDANGQTADIAFADGTVTVSYGEAVESRTWTTLCEAHGCR